MLGEQMIGLTSQPRTERWYASVVCVLFELTHSLQDESTDNDWGGWSSQGKKAGKITYN